MKIQPITHNTLAETVASKLAVSLLDGSLVPGSQLPSERELMNQLSVSRATLREALKALGKLREAMGDSKGVANASIMALRGGMVAINATTYAANRFVKNLGQPEKTITRQGLAGLASWLSIGNLLGSGK